MFTVTHDASDMQKVPYEQGSAFRSNDYRMRENPEPLDCHKYALSNPKVRTELGVVDYDVFPICKYNDLQKKKALGEFIGLDYEMCFERLDGLEELLSRVDYVAKVYLVEKGDDTPSGTGELLYKSMFEDIAKQYGDEAVLIVSASCDKMFNSTNYPAWSSAYHAAESSPYVIRSEFILEDYYICSECGEVYTDAEMPDSEECCGGWLGESPSSSQGYYYILIGDPLSEDQRVNPKPRPWLPEVDGEYVFHVTHRSHLPFIQNYGLVPKVPEDMEDTKAVYVFPSEDDMQTALSQWFGERIEDLIEEGIYTDDWVCLGIMLEGIDWDNCISDVGFEIAILHTVEPQYIRVLDIPV